MQTTLHDSLLNSVLCAIIAVDSRGDVLELNRAARDLLHAAAEPVGHSITTLFPKWDDVLDKLSGDAIQSFQEEVRLAGDETAHISVNPMPGFGWSITIHRTPAAETAQDDQAQMLGEITHDLKEPLTAILSFADLVTASGTLNDKQSRFLERIRTAATRMSDQVYQLLDVVWIESGTGLSLAPTNLLVMIKMTMDLSEARASAKHIKLVMDAPPEIPSVMADLKRLERAFANLINNAVKYSGENTTVTVQLRVEGKELALAVRDQGIGIAPEYLPRLFERFYRVQDQQTRHSDGTGLGLYVTRSIVEQHGGRITVESTPNVGSTFTVYLPIA